jgi:hypothetical protein
MKDPNIGAVGGITVPMDGQNEMIARFYSTRMQSVSNIKEVNKYDYTDPSQL